MNEQKMNNNKIKGWKRNELTGKCETVWEGLNPLEIAGNYAPQPTVLVNTSAIAVASVLAVGTMQPYIKIIQKQIQKQFIYLKTTSFQNECHRKQTMSEFLSK